MLSIGVLKVVTFQVILAYNVHRSFILIYYGGVAETGQPWQVSEVLVLTQCAYDKKIVHTYSIIYEELLINVNVFFSLFHLLLFIM